MGWMVKMKNWGGGDVSFLSEDGEAIIFAVVGEPVLIEGKFKGQETQRIAAPVFTPEGFTLLIIGKRIARRLSKYEKYFSKYVFELIRHGESGDTKTRYELVRTEDTEMEKGLLAEAKKGVSAEDLQDAIASAREIAIG